MFGHQKNQSPWGKVYEEALDASRRQRRRFWKHVTVRDGCWLWNADSGNRYGFWYLNHQKLSAHRTAKTWATRAVRSESMCCHTCRNRNCVRPSHIEWGDHHKNAQDRFRDGTHENRHGRGEAAHNAKITAVEARKMCEDYVFKGMTVDEVTAKYNRKKGTVASVVCGANWKDETSDILALKCDRKANRGRELFRPWNRKLTEDQVRAVKIALKDGGKTHQQIADTLGVKKASVTQIRMGRAWSHVVV